MNLQADGAVVGLPDEIAIGADGRGVIEGISVQADGSVRITARDVERGLEAAERSGASGRRVRPLLRRHPLSHAAFGRWRPGAACGLRLCPRLFSIST